MTETYFEKQFEELQLASKDYDLYGIRQEAFNAFKKNGIPTVKHEEWKYTRIGALFNKSYQFGIDQTIRTVTAADLNAIRLPGYQQANELVFVNGVFSDALSKILSPSDQLIVLPLNDAIKGSYKDLIIKHLGHSGKYLRDGVNALNTAFVYGGVFVHVCKGKTPLHPVYIYHIADAQADNIFSQPRSLSYIDEGAKVQFVETFVTLGQQESFTNQVMEVVVEKEALVEYYKIQQDASHANQVSTTHIHQIGKSYTQTVTIALNGGMVRNNLNVVLDAEYCEAHLYGLYLVKGQSHVDNHTIVDNVQPNCYSNEFYKGIMDEQGTGVFNGKIFVQPHAQKTNAYQSNKNILLSETANVNTKPQLEIFADDVKCSHGCTVGRLDEEALFYLRTRGIGEERARKLLLLAFASDILQEIKLEPIRTYVDQLIAERLQFNLE